MTTISTLTISTPFCNVIVPDRPVLTGIGKATHLKQLTVYACPGFEDFYVSLAELKPTGMAPCWGVTKLADHCAPTEVDVQFDIPFPDDRAPASSGDIVNSTVIIRGSANRESLLTEGLRGTGDTIKSAAPSFPSGEVMTFDFQIQFEAEYVVAHIGDLARICARDPAQFRVCNTEDETIEADMLSALQVRHHSEKTVWKTYAKQFDQIRARYNFVSYETKLFKIQT